MKLIDLLVQELPKRGGWPKGSEFCVYEHIDKKVSFTKHGAPKFKDDFIGWTILEDNDSYWILGEGFEWREAPVDFNKSIIIKPEYEAALAASRQVEWNGHSLPQTGTECEAYDGLNWYPAVVVANYDGFAFAWNYDHAITFTSMDSGYFRPLRDKEKVKRNEIAQQMCDLFGNGIELNEKEGYGKAWLDVYDAIAAGKIPGIKLAD